MDRRQREQRLLSNLSTNDPPTPSGLSPYDSMRHSQPPLTFGAGISSSAIRILISGGFPKGTFRPPAYSASRLSGRYSPNLSAVVISPERVTRQ